MTIIDIFDKTLQERSCDNLLEERKKLDREIKRRVDKKVSQIDAEYRNKSKQMRSDFYETMSKLGITIESWEEGLDSEKVESLVSLEMCEHPFYKRSYSKHDVYMVFMKNLLISFMNNGVLTDGMIFGLMLDAKLRKLDGERIEEIAKAEKAIY